MNIFVFRARLDGRNGQKRHSAAAVAFKIFDEIFCVVRIGGDDVLRRRTECGFHGDIVLLFRFDDGRDDALYARRKRFILLCRKQ